MNVRSSLLVAALVSAALPPLAAGCGGSDADPVCTGTLCDEGAGGQSGAGQAGGPAGAGAAGKAGGSSGQGGIAGKAGGGGVSGASGHGGAGAGGASGAAGAGAGGVAGASGSSGQAGSAGTAGATAGGAAGQGGGKSGASGQSGAGAGAGGSGAGAGAAGAAGSAGAGQVFPTEPILDGGATADVPGLFPAPGSETGAGPCLVEPEDKTLLPFNWLRPRIGYRSTGENLFEIRVTADGQTQPLVVYTDQTTWTMTDSLWTKVRGSLVDKDLTVTVRGGTLAGGQLTDVHVSATHTFRVAPSDAGGTIVYWTTSGGSALKGFAVGEENVTPVLVPGQVQMKTTGGAAVTCIGCHTSTPDGEYAAFTVQSPWANALAAIKPPAVGAPPSFFGPAAAQVLGSLGALGIETFSKAHWTTGDHVEVVPIGDGHNQLGWIDLEATSIDKGKGWDFLERTGDTRGAGAPAWTHDGSKIVYVSTDASTTGRLDNGAADLFTVPYNNRKGGVATALSGASDPALNEYYPAITSDDAFVLFNAIPTGNNMYNASLAEVFMLPLAGGTKQRLAANDPPMCAGKVSPGVTNSWPKSAPQVQTIKGKRYYWAIFSSTRGADGGPQLYLTGVVADEQGNLETHGAAYLWNQPSDEHNHTPAWDVFDIKP